MLRGSYRLYLQKNTSCVRWPAAHGLQYPRRDTKSPEACIKMAGLSAPAPQAQGRGVRFVAEWVWLALIGNAE